jgi:hypothetical protein
MMNIYVLSQDRGWVGAIERNASPGVVVHAVCSAGGGPPMLDFLPEADEQALLLVDASDFPNIVEVVRSLRQRGWRYVVAVATQIAWREARQVLADGHGYDYWAKSYDATVVRRDVADVLSRIQAGIGRARPAKLGSEPQTPAQSS